MRMATSVLSDRRRNTWFATGEVVAVGGLWLHCRLVLCWPKFVFVVCVLFVRVNWCVYLLALSLVRLIQDVEDMGGFVEEG